MKKDRYNKSAKKQLQTKSRKQAFSNMSCPNNQQSTTNNQQSIINNQ